MSLIILIDSREERARRVASALEAEGWIVETRRGVNEAAILADQSSPDLVVVAEGSEDATAVRRFSSAAGGPGVVVLGAQVAGSDGQVDPSGSDEEIRVGVRRILSGLSRAAVEKAAAEAASEGGQFTSQDIFGDMLAEVEEEVEAAGPAREVQPSQPAPPSPSPAPPAPAAPRPAASSGSSDLDRKLEQTLSGVLDTPKPRRKPRRPAAGGDVDALISKTLSGVVRTPSKSPASPPKAQEPEIEVVPEPVVEPPKLASRPRRKPRPSVADVDALVDGLTPRRSSRPKAKKPAPPPQPVVPPAAAKSDVPSEADVYSTMRMPIVELPEKPPELPAVDIPTMVAKPKSAAADASLDATEKLDREALKAVVEEAERKEPAAKPDVAADADEAEDQTERQQFGQYTLLDRVAVGGMAEVWKARMQGVEGFQKNVAIKRILPHLTDSPDFLTMFIDEAKLAAQLNHPNIVHIYDLGKIEEDYYIAMEYIAGKDLRSILNDGRSAGKPLPLGLAVLIASRLASGLDHAHRKRDFDNRDLGLVHRDVSPQNVLVSFDGDIKLCDFGIAKAVAKASKTQMGALKGKLQYMSPEQAWGRVVDARSDIFSLGAVLFEMLTGERLFSGASEISVLESVREGRVRAVRDIAGQVSAELDAVVAKALAKDPDERYQTAGEMQQELEAILYSLKPTPNEATLTDYMRAVYGELATEDDSQDLSPVAAAVEGTGSKAAAVPAVPPKGGAVADDETGKPLGLWLGLAAALLVIAGVVWFAMNRGTTEGGESVTPPVQAPVTTPAPAVTPTSEASEGGEVDASAGDGEADAETPATGDEGDEAAAAEPETAPEASLEDLVEEQVRERDAALDEERQELERQLEEARRNAEQAEQQAAAAAAGDAELEPAADPQPAAEEPTPEVEEPTEADEASEAVAETTPEPEPEPEPVRQPPPQPEPEPEPEAPKYTTGQMVEMGTPGLVAPRLLNIKTPEYPPMARRMKVQGTVVVAVLVDESGSVRETRIVQGVRQNVGLNEAAQRAAEGARFQPATIEGVRVKTWFNLSIPFRL